MSNRSLYVLWAVLFSICAALGFIPEPTGALRWILTGLSLLFFLPPAWIVHRGDRTGVKLVVWLSALSLGLTLALLIANVWSVTAPEAVGTALFYLLTIVSAPMVASGYWALSLFCWACLLLTALKKRKQGR